MMSIPLKMWGLLLILTTGDAIAIAPERPKQVPFSSLYVEPLGALVAGTDYAGFYRSADGGLHWTAIPHEADYQKLLGSGLAAGQLCKPQSLGQSWTCLGVAGTVSAVDGAGTLYKCAGDHIDISSDGGKSWHKTAAWTGSSASPDYCARVVVQGTEIYALGEGLYRSNDRGLHWTTVRERLNGPIVPETSTTTVAGVMARPSRALYATTTQSTTTDLSIHASVDGGRTWKRETFGLPESWRVFTLERAFSDAVYFSAAAERIPGQQPALYRSMDGKTAELMNIRIDYGSWVDVQAGPDGSIFLVTRHSIHRSGDGGKTWRKLGRDGID